MTKTKIVFAGFMGAILMSVGAANAATTSVATKGYVDQQVKTVQNTVTELQENSVTIEDVTNAVNNSITELDLGDTYEAVANKVNSISASMSAADKATKYPTVGAVLDAMPTLTEADKQAIADLTGEDGLITRVGEVENAVETLTGDGTGSVAKSIADAISSHTTVADSKYQAQSTAAYSLGNADGGWTAMTDAEQAALKSGITAAKVAEYDNLAGENGTIANIQKAVTDLDEYIKDEENGLTALVSENADAIAKNTEDIAANAAEIAKKITMPAECTAENSTCVLMVSNGDIAWTPVTSPVED